MSSPVRDIEVNVVSSPESSNSRNHSPEPDFGRMVNHHVTTCFPVIRTSDDDEKPDRDAKVTSTQKISGNSTNFSISSILSRDEPAEKKTEFTAHSANGQSVVESTNPNGTMLTR